MIKTEKIMIDGREFLRTYSDDAKMIRKIGTDEVYGEAVDPINAGREYEETDEVTRAEEISADDALEIIVGGNKVRS